MRKLKRACISMTSDPELLELINAEVEFQRSTINLTAACNYISPLVGSAMRRELSNIHCEGYPGKRFHQGQQNADAIERLAIKRACALFNSEYANVQPYRGTMANVIASVASVKPGGTILGLACDGGGHYSTGSDVHLNSHLFNIETYNVDQNSQLLDYEAIRECAKELNPQAIFGGDTSYTGQWNWEALRDIADECNAALIADVSQTAGLIAANVLSNPCEYADIVTMSTYKTLRGPRAAIILCKESYSKAVDRALFPVCQDGTNVQSIAGIAAALHEASQPAFRTYCRQVLANASALASVLQSFSYNLVSGGTHNHACMINLSNNMLSGNEAAAVLAKTGLICNSNIIPYDAGTPVNPNGLRLGTAAVTTLGMKVQHMEKIAEYTHRTLESANDIAELTKIAGMVGKLRAEFAHSENKTAVA